MKAPHPGDRVEIEFLDHTEVVPGGSEAPPLIHVVGIVVEVTPTHIVLDWYWPHDKPKDRAEARSQNELATFVCLRSAIQAIHHLKRNGNGS